MWPQQSHDETLKQEVPRPASQCRDLDCMDLTLDPQPRTLLSPPARKAFRGRLLRTPAQCPPCQVGGATSRPQNPPEPPKTLPPKSVSRAPPEPKIPSPRTPTTSDHSALQTPPQAPNAPKAPSRPKPQLSDFAQPPTSETVKPQSIPQPVLLSGSFFSGSKSRTWDPRRAKVQTSQRLRVTAFSWRMARVTRRSKGSQPG